MAKSKGSRVIRKGRVSVQEANRLNEIRRKAMEDFPPDPNRPQPATTGIGAQIRAAREAKGLTWYAVAKLAGIPNPATIRDIEYGRDAKLSNIEALATALDLKLELVEQNAC
ncbi:MAG: helix-turn-helix transcriptional regulator [Planctomycetes bacterium]|nr:helix-turn-helix transcriptional regulator [Planctomycetota bacterium]MBL7037267.1 helix-turn-helix transcriptional regulator [Pirellulaceae bacterium]